MMSCYRLAVERASRLARRAGCMYCGNTGTANGAPCPVCRGGAR
jgi:hypothetical protein